MKANIKVHLIVSILTSLLLFLIIGFFIYYQASLSLRDMTDKKLSKIVNNIDETLTFAENSLLETNGLLASDCTKDVLERLRVVVAKSPNIRSIELIRDGSIYCSSVFGVSMKKNYHYDKKRLFVYISEVTNPGVPFLSLQHFAPKSNYSVVSTIDGFYINDAVTSADLYFPVYFQIDNKPIPALSSGLENGSKSNASSGFHVYKKSHVEDYSIHSYFSRNNVITYVIENETSFIMMAFFSSLITGLFVFFILQREKPLKEHLRKAVKNNEIVPWIQPIFDKKGNIYGGEILARWIHPELGMISPEEFITLAENNNLISPLTQSLLIQVQKKLSNTWNLLPVGSHLAFNVSPECFKQKSIISDFDIFLDGFHGAKPNLVLEVTERQPLSDDISLTVIKALQSRNIKIALDDFGTGYSNLYYLQNLNFDFIKIDKSFVRDLSTKIHVGNIIENIVQMTHSIGAQNIAEGVETEEQLDELKSLDVEYYQGYLLAKPMTLDKFNAELTKS